MKNLLKVVVAILAVILIGVALLLTYVKTALPNVGQPEDITIERTSERLERGAYLVNAVTGCLDCHSARDWSQFAGPVSPGSEGMGGEEFNQQMGFPGRYVAANLTPAGIGEWTDGELLRAITTGVSRDGRALFPIMPHHNYGQMDEEDIKSIIAYIRTLNPIENVPAKSSSDFPINFIINTIPKKATFQSRPPESDKVAYGKYLVTAGSCNDCHTNQVEGKVVGEPFAGGMEFPFPTGDRCRSSNITPHSTGIGDWTEQQFVERFKHYADSSYVPERPKPGEFQTLMPWHVYANMTESDLKAIYAYLMTLEPKENKVERFTSAENM